MTVLKTNKVDSVKSYLAKDFNSLKADLISYAKNYFPDKIQDFSEAGVGGLLVELAAFVGDTMTFYLDYQFSELNPETAVEIKNIQAHARNAGLKISGAAPSVVDVSFFIEVPAKISSDGNYQPDQSTLPVINSTTTVSSNSGVSFVLMEDLDFSLKDQLGNLKCTFQVSQKDSNGNPSFFILRKNQTCISGKLKTQTFNIPNQLIPFRTITISDSDVTEILKVSDSSGNIYYKVESLTEDTVFNKVENLNKDLSLVSSNLEVMPAPYRYVTETDFTTKQTKIQFGSGEAETTDDDIFPDPSELAIPLYGKKQFSKFSLNPNKLLQTRTLGISPVNTTITVVYKYGGGLSDNVSSNSIRAIDSLSIDFPNTASVTVQNSIIQSLEIINESQAKGGANSLTLEEVRSLISLTRNQQSRIVTQQDLLARLYTLPSEFGRIFRAGLRKNEENPLSTDLFIVGKDIGGNLIICPDSLKKNIRNYINEFRLISDSINVLDTTVINYSISFSIVCKPDANKNAVIANVIDRIKNTSDLKFFQIDQPILRSDIINAVINTEGVLSMISLEFNNLRGNISGNAYSDFEFDMSKNSYKGLIVGPPGSIFELKFPEINIVGTAE